MKVKSAQRTGMLMAMKALFEPFIILHRYEND